MDDPVLHDLRQLLLRNTIRRMDFIQRIHKIVHIHPQILHVLGNARHSPHLHVPIKRETRRALHQTANLRARKVLRQLRKLREIDVVVHDAVRSHLGGVDVQDLEPAGLVGKRDLHVDLETAGTEEGLVNHVDTVGHADDQDVIQLVDTVHLGEDLVDDSVAYASAAAGGTTLFEDGVELVEDDDVEAALVALLFILQERSQ